MKNIWTILCEKSSIDLDSSLISIFNCVEELKLVFNKSRPNEQEKTFINTNFQLVSLWIIDNPEEDTTLDLKIEVIDPNNQIINNFTNSFTIKKNIKRFRNRINIQSLPITKNGRYYINTWTIKDDKSNLVSEIPIDIEISHKIN